MKYNEKYLLWIERAFRSKRAQDQLRCRKSEKIKKKTKKKNREVNHFCLSFILKLAFYSWNWTRAQEVFSTTMFLSMQVKLYLSTSGLNTMYFLFPLESLASLDWNLHVTYLCKSLSLLLTNHIFAHQHIKGVEFDLQKKESVLYIPYKNETRILPFRKIDGLNFVIEKGHFSWEGNRENSNR